MDLVKMISVDVAEDNWIEVKAKQQDSGTRYLTVTLTNEGEPINVPTGVIVAMNVHRADNEAKSFEGAVNQDGSVTVPLNYWMLAVSGKTYVDVSIIDGTNVLSTMRFILDIDKAAVSDDDIERDADYSILVQLIEKVEDIDEHEDERIANETGRQAAETARVSAESARASAESLRVSNETERQTAENTRVLSETARNSNESNRISAENGRVAAETTRVEAESGRVSAESERATAETARVTAESARVSAETIRVENEETRGDNESIRVSKEAERAENESARNTAETSRATAESARQTAESGRASAESTRQSNETARQTAESTRASQESSRVSAETARISAENTRTSQESARQTAESTRQSNETARETNTATAISNANTATQSATNAAEAANSAAEQVTEVLANLDERIANKADKADIDDIRSELNDITTLNGIIAGHENYKGTIGVGGRITQLPVIYDIGWFYRVVTPGTYAGKECAENDLLIAMVDRNASGNLDTDWYKLRPTNGNIIPGSWADFTALTRSGLYKRVLDVGDVVTLRYNNTDVPFQIIGFDIGVNADNEKLTNSIRFQSVNNILNREFDVREAFYSQDTILPAGTYNFKVTNYTWLTTEQGKYYQFTLLNDAPAEAQLMFTQEYNATLEGAKIRVYSKGDATILEEAVMTEGQDGTYLGELKNTLGTDFNSSQRTVIGNNRYSQSNLRIWLNAAPDAEPGTLWTPQNKWDRAPEWLRTGAGFQSLVDPELLAVVGTSKLTVAKNTLCDGGGSEIVNDKFFLLSRDEVYGGYEISSVTEGLTCQFYSKYSELSAAGTGADANRKKKTGASYTYWWLRTPGSGFSSRSRSIFTDGSVNTNAARLAYGCAPAFDIY